MYKYQQSPGASSGNFVLYQDLGLRDSPTFSAGEGGEGGLDLNDPKVQEAVANAAADQAEAKLKELHGGLLKNRDEFKAEKQKLEDEIKQLREAVKNWEGLNAEEVRRVMANIQASEEAKLVADGKTDEVVKIRTERLRSDYDTRIKKLENDLQAAIAERQRVRALHDTLRIQTATNAAIMKDGGITESAPPDILMSAERIFGVDDKGNIVSYEGEGDERKVVLGKDGETPLSLSEWLASMKDHRPHWWKAPAGGGAASAERDASSGVTGYTAEQIRTMPPAQYRELRQQGKIR